MVNCIGNAYEMLKLETDTRLRRDVYRSQDVTDTSKYTLYTTCNDCSNILYLKFSRSLSVSVYVQ